MPFKPGTSGNPAGRPRKAIANLSRAARGYGRRALATLVEIMENGEERNRLTAAKELLDRGYGRPVQAVDVLLMTKKIGELSMAELMDLNMKLLSSGATAEAEPIDIDLPVLGSPGDEAQPIEADFEEVT